MNNGYPKIERPDPKLLAKSLRDEGVATGKRGVEFAEKGEWAKAAQCFAHASQSLGRAFSVEREAAIETEAIARGE
ncbi:MAG: hypothetical protein PVSMB8_12480 [Vulcanimicrobiaceae bacterium]